MLRASLVLCVISVTVTACAKDPIRAGTHALVELRAKADPLSAYCRSGHWSVSANRTLDVAACTEAPFLGALPRW